MEYKIGHHVGTLYQQNGFVKIRKALLFSHGSYKQTHGGETMMIPEKLLEIMKLDGVVAIATLGKDGPHMVNTWNSYIKISPDGRLFIPAGYMHKTEVNVAHNPDVLITLVSSKVKGLHGAGAGFLIIGKGNFYIIRT
jgi:hypothetical protein